MTGFKCLNKQNFSLTYLDHFKIMNKAGGLREPSGLALAHGKNSLWTISDDTKKIFKLSLDVNVRKGKPFEVPDSGLEGIVLEPTGVFLLTVKEDGYEIIKIKVVTQKVVHRRRLDEKAGYNQATPKSC